MDIRSLRFASWVFAVVLGLSGCTKTKNAAGDSHEQLAADLAVKCDHIVDLIATVKDVPTAEAAVGELKKVEEDFGKLQARVKALKDVKVAPATREKYLGTTRGFQNRFKLAISVLELDSPEGFKIVQAAMPSLGAAITALGGEFSSQGL